MVRLFKRILFCSIFCAVFLFASVVYAQGSDMSSGGNSTDQKLKTVLREAGFTGRIELTLQAEQFCRPIDRQLADLGRMLWFDTITGLNNDNTCAGCHSPTNGFGDTQSIAIGIENNGVVGPDRRGPRNMRRSPMVDEHSVLTQT